jgi:spore coat polysaccharide biosynthesis predicted glycosyltransferase SpsG/RimJ/RimL family protein N-acetyltransferase
MTTLLLRADGGATIGVGHLSRCLAFAEAAVARGWRTLFAGDLGGAAWLAARFTELGVPLLPPAAFGEVDADVVLVDHYGLGELPEVRERARLVSLEDGHWGRRAADIVVDSSLALSARRPDGSPVLLAGPRFAPVRGDVRVARRSGFTAGDPPRVVVVMGGGAAGATVAAALTALRDTGVPLFASAVAAGPVPLPDPAPGQRFAAHPPTPTLPTLFAEADLVVSAAGVTLTELCCIGAPAALVQLVDNQAAGYTAALDQGLAVGLGTPADLPAAAGVLRALLLEPARRRALAEAASAAVDGAGAERVLDATELTVREATAADTELLLAWRNDPRTLAWSRGHQPVTRPVHESWLRAALANPDRLLLVVEQAGAPVGTVRFDREETTTWEVSITLAPSHRGRGLAARALMMGEGALHARAEPDVVLANVHEDNDASLALFRHAGYRPATRSADGPFTWLTKVTPRRVVHSFGGCPQPTC